MLEVCAGEEAVDVVDDVTPVHDLPEDVLGWRVVIFFLGGGGIRTVVTVVVDWVVGWLVLDGWGDENGGGEMWSVGRLGCLWRPSFHTHAYRPPPSPTNPRTRKSCQGILPPPPPPLFSR